MVLQESLQESSPIDRLLSLFLLMESKAGLIHPLLRDLEFPQSFKFNHGDNVVNDHHVAEHKQKQVQSSAILLLGSICHLGDNF